MILIKKTSIIPWIPAGNVSGHTKGKELDFFFATGFGYNGILSAGLNNRF